MEGGDFMNLRDVLDLMSNNTRISLSFNVRGLDFHTDFLFVQPLMEFHSNFLDYEVVKMCVDSECNGLCIRISGVDDGEEEE